MTIQTVARGHGDFILYRRPTRMIQTIFLLKCEDEQTLEKVAIALNNAMSAQNFDFQQDNLPSGCCQIVVKDSPDSLLVQRAVQTFKGLGVQILSGQSDDKRARSVEGTPLNH